MNFDMNKLVRVKNRSAGLVVYNIRDQRIRREFHRGEVKMLPYQELVWLSYQPGGRSLMQNKLLIEDPEATSSLNIRVEPEYKMTEQDIVDLLQNGSLDALLDALDFAPTGVIDIIKNKAVTLPLYDMQKRQAIQNATGFNVTAAIENSQADEDEAPAKGNTPTRRVQPSAEKTSAPARRTPPKEYKIISQEAQ